jgi:hypothetical protein
VLLGFGRSALKRGGGWSADTKGAAPAQAGLAEAGRAPGGGVHEDQKQAAWAQARHGVRGGQVPEHRRVLGRRGRSNRHGHHHGAPRPPSPRPLPSASHSTAREQTKGATPQAKAASCSSATSRVCVPPSQGSLAKPLYFSTHTAASPTPSPLFRALSVHCRPCEAREQHKQVERKMSMRF